MNLFSKKAAHPTNKKYKCSKCGHITTQCTNHYRLTTSHDKFNTCPQCPPYRKYPEYGGQTIWICMESKGSLERKIWRRKKE